MKWRNALVIIGLSVAFVAACSAEEETQKNGNPTGIPQVRVIVDDTEAQPTLVAQTLQTTGNPKEANEGIEKLAEDVTPVQAEPSSLVQIYVEPDDELEKVFIRQWENNTAKMVKTNDNQYTLPAEPGTYIYEIMSYYTHGDMQHVYTITVE